MKNKLLLTAALVLSTAPAMAQTPPATNTPSAALVTPVADPVMDGVSRLQTEWARIKYQMADKEAQLVAIHTLEGQAAQLTAMYPQRPEPKIWEGIILSTDAGIVKGLSALDKVDKAKTLFEESIRLDPQALNGSAYTSLGSLYYQVPGWPVAFGDDEMAEQNLKQALVMNPDGIDPNYFYGDFLLQDGRPVEAKTYLERALMAPDRPGRELADAGRRQEIKAALAKIDATGKNTGTQKYN